MKVSLAVIALALAGCLALLGITRSSATSARDSSEQKEQSSMAEFEGKVNAPDFPEGAEWLNTDRPLSLRELRGKIVLLDFWTYCCINCIHIIPDLKRLEEKYADELVVIGVHSAKFQGERDTDNIRQAILRYEIEHPVVNDWRMETWQQYGVRAWPTLVLIDPAGKVIGGMSGEGIYDPFDRLISKVISAFDAKGQLDRRPLNLKLERHRAPGSMLAFPGKVLADEKTRQLFISDSNHNRIVVASLQATADKEVAAKVTQVVGSGEVGMLDGDFATATFNHPQGMAFDGKSLYVADTENHAIRRIDFDKRAVTTIAGTGKQARRLSQPGGAGRQVDLNSPWDVVLQGDTLYIAMAGPHQLWKLDTKTNEVAPYAGSGYENIVDGPLAQAALAQPSGITTDGKKLYFADSEVSAVRSADLDPKGQVQTIVGEGLFDFGDKDGKASQARLQHPLGVVYHNNALYVADTYNNKIKKISLEKLTSETYLGTGEEGMSDGARATFDEPGGVSVAMGKLFIADTNNHLIRVADLETKQVKTLQIEGLVSVHPRATSARFRGETIELSPQSVEPGEGTLTIQLELPAGYKLNSQAPSALLVASLQKQVVSLNNAGEQGFRNPQFPISIPIKVSEGQTAINAMFVVYYCEEGKESLCYFKEAQVSIPVKARKGAGNRKLSAAYKVAAP